MTLAWGANSWSETVTDDAITTPFGTRFSQSCKAFLPNLNTTQIENLRHVIRKVFSQMKSCALKYPELTPYLNDAQAIARTSQIECAVPDKGHRDAAAWNDLRGKTTLTPVTISRLAADEDKPWNSYVLLHEFLHSTGANNRADHHTLQVINPTSTHGPDQKVKPNRCEDDVTLDRVNVIASLCSATPLYRSKNAVLDDLFDRVSGCGMKRGCIDTFTSAAPMDGTPFKNIQPEAAISLCSKIYEEGLCAAHIERDGAKLIRSLPRTQELQKKINARLIQVFPTRRGEITAAILDFYPDLREKLRAFESNHCFTSTIWSSPHGSLHLMSDRKNPRDARIKNPLREIGLGGSDLASFYGVRWKAELESALRSNPLCTQSESSILSVFNSMIEELSHDVRAEAWEPVIHLALGEWDKSFEKQAQVSVDFSKPSLILLSKLLGHSLYRNYEDTMITLNPYSPHFDCEQAGLSLFRSGERAVRTLKNLETQHYGACP